MIHRPLASFVIVLLVCPVSFGSQKQEPAKASLSPEKELADLELQLLNESEKIIRSKYKHRKIETFDSIGRATRSSNKRYLISGFAIDSSGKKHDFYVFFILDGDQWKPWQSQILNETLTLDDRLKKRAEEDQKTTKGPRTLAREIMKPSPPRLQ